MDLNGLGKGYNVGISNNFKKLIFESNNLTEEQK